MTGDVITDLTEDLAAEQKARTTYDNILRLADDPDVKDAIKFLRQREVVHVQRFGEGLRLAQDRPDAKNFYAFNPAFINNPFLMAGIASGLFFALWSLVFFHNSKGGAAMVCRITTCQP